MDDGQCALKEGARDSWFINERGAGSNLNHPEVFDPFNSPAKRVSFIHLNFIKRRYAYIINLPLDFTSPFSD